MLASTMASQRQKPLIRQTSLTPALGSQPRQHWILLCQVIQLIRHTSEKMLVQWKQLMLSRYSTKLALKVFVLCKRETSAAASRYSCIATSAHSASLLAVRMDIHSTPVSTTWHSSAPCPGPATFPCTHAVGAAGAPSQSAATSLPANAKPAVA